MDNHGAALRVGGKKMACEVPYEEEID